jgi:GNAT superfamily N-acetyltransferase
MISVRRAKVEDCECLVEFNCALARETEGRELNRTIVTRGVRRAFEQGDEAVYFVACRDTEIVGSLMLTREWSDWRDGWLVWIQSVYVVPQQRGRGVFRTLLQHASELAHRDPDVVGLRLYVENENQRAQSVYLRSGFSDPGYKVLEKLRGGEP